MHFKTKCPNCNHEVGYDVTHLVEVSESWCLDFEKCENQLITFSFEERMQIIQGIQLTEKYVPNVINAYHNLNIDGLPSKISFGRITSKENEKMKGSLNF
ncbi:hypothetical protein [Brevibacillus sp. NRS-1366]|uniref:hypothetical protein n=1 Tax=Brevibacillus sp. NRS-1366 TaxID=3233899 RepID=UPI003D230192